MIGKSGRLLLCFLLLPASQLIAQSIDESKDSTELQLKLYGSFRGHFAAYNKEVEIQENASRLGFEISAIRKGIRYFAGLEMQVNMFRSATSFNLSASTTGGYLQADRNQDRQVLSSRLGYMGVDLGKWGTVVLGKQRSIYYDITGYTDRFNVFGGGASATYTAGTDGGYTGTGRADQALTYRNSTGRFSYGAQFQFLNSNNNRWLDGLAFNLQVQLIEQLKFGIVVNQSFLNPSLINSGEFIGLKGNPRYYAAGVNYRAGNWEIAGLFSRQQNGDAVTGRIIDPVNGISNPVVVFEAVGGELYFNYHWKKISVLLGGNYYQPDTDIFTSRGERPINAAFKRRYIIAGAEYRPFRLLKFYSEARIANGTAALGSREPSVFTIGLRLDAEGVFSKKLYD
ncbi:MAG: porin [Flavihumibacter sp.]|nr:porin [Flavihumibacter sp.]